MLVLASTLAVGGGERVLSRLLTEIRDRGVRVELLTLKATGAVGEELSEAGIPVRALGHGNTRNPIILFQLVRELRRANASLLYIQDHHDCLFWGRLAAALAGFVPALSPVHSSAQGQLRAFRPLNRLLLGLSPNLVTLGDWQQEALKANETLPGGFWNSIPNPVDGTFEPPPPAGAQARPGPEALVLGTVAALRPEKRQDRLLEMAAALMRHISLELWLIGEGPERHALEAQAEELGIRDRVRFWGHRDDVASLLSCLDLFLLTSSEEALPLSLLEAVRAGVPVAAPPHGAIPGLLEGGRRGLLLEGDDPTRWAHQVAGYIGHLPDADELSGWAGEVETRYSTERFVDRYLRLLEWLGLAG